LGKVLKATIVVLGGDGIGPEVTAEAVRVLQTVAEKFKHEFMFTERLVGGCSIDTLGTPLTEETLAACKSADAVLLGAVGGPQWDNPNAPTRPEDGLLALRKGLGLYANLRPVKPHPALLDASPVKTEKLRGVDLIVVRELTGGLYFGKPKGRQRINGHVRAVDTLEYHDHEIERILRLAFQLSRHRRKKVTSVDKANVLETSRLWRQTANALAAENTDIALEHMLVDTASMRLISSPGHFDVLVTENMFGDILTDEASVLAGSMGLLPSASLGDRGPGLYEPIHGSAPDIAGKGIANPIGSILSAAMLLQHSLHLDYEASAVESAVGKALDDGCRTADLGGKLSTTQMTDAIVEGISKV
jgi:3-isopropylmalate dehydrogenase